MVTSLNLSYVPVSVCTFRSRQEEW